jgi:hypothetical protein
MEVHLEIKLRFTSLGYTIGSNSMEFIDELCTRELAQIREKHEESLH